MRTLLSLLALGAVTGLAATTPGITYHIDGNVQPQHVVNTYTDYVQAPTTVKGIRPLGTRRLPDGRQEVSLIVPSEGGVYGAGEKGYSLNLRGDTLTLYNKQNYGYRGNERRIQQMGITMPLLVSSEGWAVVFDDYAAAELIVGDTIKYITEAPHPVGYWVIDGEGSMPTTVERLTALTGRQDLPPLWTLGYITSKYGYRTEAETRGVIDTLKAEGYPVDGIVLDLYWYGKEQDMGRLAWDPVQWPTHQQMLADLKAQGVHLIPISQPYVLRNGHGIDNYNELAPKGYFVRDSTGLKPQEVQIWVGEGGMFDVSNPKTRAWLAERYRQLTDEGVSGWWGDLGEPEVHPETGRHHNGLTARQYHNRYGNDWSEIIYDLFAEQYPTRRLATMMRGGTTGLQRYSVLPWTTDVSRTWGGLEPQVVLMLSSGLSGLGYMSSDIGGFSIIDPEHEYDPELYVRWLQMGTFSPILRTHAQKTPEPYHYGQYKDIILPLVQERYRMLPYIYGLAAENAATGQPLVRPVGYYSPDPSAYDGIRDEYLLGRDLLVAPVMTPATDKRQVILPAGGWALLTHPTTQYQGPDTVMVDAPLDVIPVFVRLGSIIPTADHPMHNTGEYTPARLTLNCYYDGQPMEGRIFEDDGTRYDINNPSGHAAYTQVRIQAINGVVHADIEPIAEAYEGMPQQRDLTFKIYGIYQPVKEVRDAQGQKVPFTYSAEDGLVTFQARYKAEEGAKYRIN